MQSVSNDLSPTLLKLRQCPKPKRFYPKGTPQSLTKPLATRFCDLIATSLVSTSKLLEQNPDLPTFKTLESWRFRYPWFDSLWTNARKRQAEFLMQHCLDLANATEPKTAHVARVRFDIYRFLASKFNPDVYGDKSHQQQTTVNVGISIPSEQISALRSKLESSRIAFLPTSNKRQDSHDESPT